MCRIIGGWEFGGESLGCLFANIEKMRDSMRNGGPDDCGVYFSQTAQVTLAHRRLSIIDLSSFSHQPFKSSNGRYILVFNGEIYNYKEIAKRLSKEGIFVEGKSDTEVLLVAFMHYGMECVQFFDGMFAFAIWDEIEQKLYLCRDRMGVKPLYYYFDGNVFLFSSELKGILHYPKLLKNINKESLGFYFAFGYIPAPLSILESCHKLEKGHYLVLDSKRNLNKICYEDLRQYFRPKQDFSEKQFESLLKESIARRMVSDVPVGVCLSGGVDSSLVCAVLKECGYTFDTFSIGFKEQSFNESHFAREVANALGVKNHCFMCSVDESKELIAKLPFVYDEPFGDSSAIPTLLLMQEIVKTHKVALSADGGDELMLGYDRYFWAKQRWEKYRSFRAFKVLQSLLMFSPEMSIKVATKFGLHIGVDKFLRIKNQLKAKSFLEHYLVEISHFRSEEFLVNGMVAPKILKFAMGDDFDVMGCFDLQCYLPDDILVKTDRASMSVGLEIREPLLGIDFVRYVLSLKSGDKIQSNNGKIIFKKYLEKFLSRDLIYRSKMGFGVPLESWMKGDLYFMLEDVIEYIDGFLDAKYVRKLLSDFKNNIRVDFAKIWYIYSFCAWRKQWRI